MIIKRGILFRKEKEIIEEIFSIICFNIILIYYIIVFSYM